MRLNNNSITLLRIVYDYFLLTISFCLSFLFLYQDYFSQLRPDYILSTFFLLIIVWFTSSKFTSLYEEFHSHNLKSELLLVTENILVQIAAFELMSIVLYKSSIPHILIFVYSSIALILIFSDKYLIRLFLTKRRKDFNLERNVVIVGIGEESKAFYDEVIISKEFSYVLLGFLDDKLLEFNNERYLGRTDDLEEVLRNNSVNEVVILKSIYPEDRINGIIKICEQHTTRIHIISDFFKTIPEHKQLNKFDKFQIITMREDRSNEIHWRITKRIFDIILTSILFITVFWWLWPLISIFVKVHSPGPVFFKQERWGRENKIIICYKFRSMTPDSKDLNSEGEYLQASKDDPRVTKIGKLLRKSNFDELPQFWNVLKGDMSIVGPRPHPIPLNLASRDKVTGYMQRTLVKPGITGWAQVNGSRGETKELHQMQKRINYDLWYIENWSFWLDIKILFLTILCMLKGDPNAY